MAAHAAIQAASHPRAYKAWFADLASPNAILGRKGGTIGGYGWSNHKPPHFIYNARAREAFEKPAKKAAHAAKGPQCWASRPDGWRYRPLQAQRQAVPA